MPGKVVVTGATGFLGRHVVPILSERYGSDNVTGISSVDYDLMDPVQVKKMFEDLRPNVVVHLAAYSGQRPKSGGKKAECLSCK